MPDMSDYIWIVDAASEYRRSRKWLDRLVESGRLTYAKFEGDRRVYLKRSELNKLLGKPIEEGRKGSEDGQQSAG